MDKECWFEKELLYFGVTGKKECLFLLVQVQREPELVRGCTSNVIISTETALEAQLINPLAAAYSFPLTLTINIWHGEPDFLAVVSLLGWPS